VPGVSRIMPSAKPLHEIVKAKLYSVDSKKLLIDHLAGVTTIVNVSGNPDIVPDYNAYQYLYWMTDKKVNASQFEGVVRMVSSTIKGSNMRVLLIGYQDTVDTIATCVLREYLGCDTETALRVMRKHRKTCMTKSELLETAFKYKLS
jgi:hypothetical protein